MSDDAGRLHTEEGRSALAEAMAEHDPSSLAAATRLRKRFSPELAAEALGQAVLRRKAHTKFGDAADGLFLTHDGLEQATRPAVSRWRAERLRDAGIRRVVDLGCGIGADSLACLAVGIDVVAVELDATTAWHAAANLGAGEPVHVVGGPVGFLGPFDRLKDRAPVAELVEAISGSPVAEPVEVTPPHTVAEPVEVTSPVDGPKGHLVAETVEATSERALVAGSVGTSGPFDRLKDQAPVAELVEALPGSPVAELVEVTSPVDGPKDHLVAEPVEATASGLVAEPVEATSPRAVVIHGDAVALAPHLLAGAGPDTCVFVDPARRTERGRTWDVSAFTPPWEFVTGLLAGEHSTVVKLGPGVPRNLLPGDVEAVFVSEHGDVVECSLWNTPDATPGRSALLLPDGIRVTTRGEALPVAPLGRYLVEANGAVTRAGALDALADDLWLLDADVAYLSSDEPVDQPGATCFEVLEDLDFNEKQLRAWVRDQRIGTLEIKKRAVDVDPAALRKRLKPKGSNSATLVIARTTRGTRALHVRRLPRAARHEEE